jgi:hypothetical protein
LFTFAAAVSAVLCVAVCAMWPTSYRGYAVSFGLPLPWGEVGDAAQRTGR